MMFVRCVSENEVDDDASSDIDRNPGYRVLTWESGGDFAEVFGACYDLQETNVSSWWI